MSSSWTDLYLRPTILAVLCFLIFNFSTVIYKARLTIQGVSYLFFCHDKKWAKQPDPKLAFEPIIAANEVDTKVEKKTLIFVRHGESTWNDTFNKGAHRSALVFAIGYIPGIIKSLLYEFYLLLSGKIDSWFYDSPLSHLGLAQVQELADFLNSSKEDATSNTTCMDKSFSEEERKLILQILRNDPNAPPSKLVSSNLRRALSTIAAAFQDRLLRDPQESILILPSLQEISRNPDTLSITPSQTKVKPSWIESSSKVCDFASIFSKQVDMQFHHGNKPIDTNGMKRMLEFCNNVYSSRLPEDYIVVGGHSIWFRSFFREFLPNGSDHVGKVKKIVNCGAIKFDLWRMTTDDGRYKYMMDEDSIRVVFGGFK